MPTAQKRRKKARTHFLWKSVSLLNIKSLKNAEPVAALKQHDLTEPESVIKNYFVAWSGRRLTATTHAASRGIEIEGNGRFKNFVNRRLFTFRCFI